MNKNVKKLINIILTCILILFISSTVVFGENSGSTKPLTGDEIKGQADKWLDEAESPIDATEVANIIKPIANILLAIGSVVIVVVGVIIGIKYVTAAPDKQAQLKTQLVGLVVSAVVLFGAYGIWSIAYQILDGLFG